jgi:hypothetical protein
MKTAIPGSYQQAIADGWRVVHEETPLVYGEGRLLLCRDGVPESIAIGYQPTATGYQYATPQITTEDLAGQAEDCWVRHFAEFGCAACSTTEAPHAGYGLCQTCVKRVSGQIDEAIAA